MCEGSASGPSLQYDLPRSAFFFPTRPGLPPLQSNEHSNIDTARRADPSFLLWSIGTLIALHPTVLRMSRDAFDCMPWILGICSFRLGSEVRRTSNFGLSFQTRSTSHPDRRSPEGCSMGGVPKSKPRGKAPRR